MRKQQEENKIKELKDGTFVYIDRYIEPDAYYVYTVVDGKKGSSIGIRWEQDFKTTLSC